MADSLANLLPQIFQTCAVLFLSRFMYTVLVYSKDSNLHTENDSTVCFAPLSCTEINSKHLCASLTLSVILTPSCPSRASHTLIHSIPSY